MALRAPVVIPSAARDPFEVSVRLSKGSLGASPLGMTGDGASRLAPVVIPSVARDPFEVSVRLLKGSLGASPLGMTGDGASRFAGGHPERSEGSL
jgi:hypothetical protein